MSKDFESDAAFQSHKHGRTAFEPVDNEWPVVTRSMLAKESELGEPGPDDNPLVTSLLRGYIYLANAERHLQRALVEARKRGDEKLVGRIGNEIERMRQVKEEWPLTIV